MKILYSWLKEYIDLDIPPGDIAERLGMLGLEVESVENPGRKYDGFVVGLVLSVDRHPNADKLTVCAVRVAPNETLQIVCGAPNVAPGLKVAVGRPGAMVPRNQHDAAGTPFPLKRTTIRGTASEGMICSAYELDLGDDAGGILVLDRKARIGMPLSRYLGIDETVLDIEVTPNRPDWLGHIGVAREIGVINRGRLKLPLARIRESAAPARSRISVVIEDRENCNRFAVRFLRGLTIGPSPAWLQRRLQVAGLRPINNVVDVTNYVMLETGHPLHAFDAARIHGGRLVIKGAEDDHPFTTLDGNEVKIPKGAVMVCDADRELSIAGIMGGLNSAIEDSTSEVVLEAAHWNSSSIRRTARKSGINSDASYRFERGTDPNGVLYALNRAASLIQDVSGAEVLRGVVDVYPRKTGEKKIGLRPERVNHVLGTSLNLREIRSLLRPLGILPASGKSPKGEYRVPTFRVDLDREIDLIEEVARVLGYDRIPESTFSAVSLPQHPLPADPADQVRSILVGLGFQEALTIPIQASSLRDPGRDPVTILNPLSSEMNTLRSSLVPGLLSAIGRNIRYGNPDLKMFEIGHVFAHDRSAKPKLIGDFLEEEKVALVRSGLAHPRQWGEPGRAADIYDLKGDVASLLESLLLDKCRFISYSTSDSLVEAALRIETNGSVLGYVGSVRNEVLKAFDIEQPVLVAEMDTELLNRPGVSSYVPLPKFPRVRRDVAFVVEKSVPAQAMEEVLLSASSGLLRRVELFDLYEGDPLPAGKRSLAFSLEIISTQRTLTDREIEEEVQRAVVAAGSRFGAVVRT